MTRSFWEEGSDARLSVPPPDEHLAHPMKRILRSLSLKRAVR